jgi:hypothetical protein
MVSELAPHDVAAADGATPFDLVLDRDAIVVFRLEPGAWEWESEPARALFLKEERDGRPQPHDPFSEVESPPSQPRLLAARFHAPAELSGCAYAYNLGVVVKQRGQATPLVIDPEIKNGVGD